jgi:hypothetical protein
VVKAQPNSQHHKSKIFSYKVFTERPSLLTNSGSGFRTLENIFIAFLILLGVQICVDEYFETGSLLPDLNMLFWVFAKLDKVFQTTISLFIIHIMIVPFV